jgi:hypothetical protein
MRPFAMRPTTAPRPGRIWPVVAAVWLALLPVARLAATGAPAPVSDTAPSLLSASPADGATAVSPRAPLRLTFSEPVALAAGAVRLDCARGGRATLLPDGGPVTFELRPDPPLLPGDDCQWLVLAEGVSDLDGDDPPDAMPADVAGRFSTAVAPDEMLRINELDPTVAIGGDELVELFDGGAGETPLDGLVLVLFDGASAAAYASFDLDGRQTDASGYLVIGSGPAADIRFGAGELRDGLGAAGLYAADAADFPIGRQATVTGLVDAAVYGAESALSDATRALLLPGQQPLDEGAAGDAAGQSLGRCPNGGGERRASDAFRNTIPSPGGTNTCNSDAPPGVLLMYPLPEATAVPLTVAPVITFTEPVRLDGGAIAIQCALSGEHGHLPTAAGAVHVLSLTSALEPGETCQVTVNATAVHDSDSADPPDLMLSDHAWRFTTKRAVATSVLINELDTDTPGRDVMEFVELTDGGKGNTSLDGLVLVFFNGGGDAVYRTVDLSGQKTDARGLLTVGNKAVPGVDLVIPDAAVQNGPDAVAIFEGSADDFPSGASVATTGLIDAVVYGSAATPDPGLLPLLLPGEGQVDEGGRGMADTDSSQRCPNGGGAQRATGSIRQRAPTPDEPNGCPPDPGPAVAGVSPLPGEDRVEVGAGLTITFTEAVQVTGKWLTLNCDASGNHGLATSGGPLVFSIRPASELGHDETCAARITASRVTDLDGDDPLDALAADYLWQFTTAPPPPQGVFINELDADTPGSDAAEFIELYDGGKGQTGLAGLILVLFNGSDDRSYRTVDLAPATTDGQGYLVIGNSAVPGVDIVIPDGSLQNGVDALGLYARSPASFPNGTAVTLDGLLDAVVYGQDDVPDAGLLPLLAAGQAIIAESSRGSADAHSLQRCPNGSGAPRHTDTFVANSPSPGLSNTCALDEAPAVIATTPAAGSDDVPIDAVIDVEFSEPVDLNGAWYTLVCEASGDHPATVSRDGTRVQLHPQAPFLAGEACRLLVKASAVTDSDDDDPPDAMTADFELAFSTAETPVARVLINEIDSDTPGSDEAEFVELFDGGQGNTSLAGLTLVFYNGSTDKSYFALGLDGLATDALGYSLIGNSSVPGVDRTFANGKLQNGPDAVALYAASAAAFPTGTAVTSTNLVDAVVYGNPLAPDAGLLALLDAGQPQVSEDASQASETHSLQRCPDGAGGFRRTEFVQAHLPTPAAANRCIADSAPAVAQVMPAGGEQDVELLSTLTVTFTEPITPAAPWLALECTTSGSHTLEISGGPQVFTARPGPLAPDERCDAVVKADRIHDVDSDDPPDAMAADFRWSFTTAGPLCGRPRAAIAAIQGRGTASPRQGELVTVEGVVSAILPGRSGLFLSALPGDVDSDPATSEAVAITGLDLTAVDTGDRIRVTGTVREQEGRTTLFDATLDALCGEGEALPPIALSVPISPAAWEAVEGMAVTLGPALVVASADDLPESGRLLVSRERPVYATETLAPGQAAIEQLAADLSATIALDYALVTAPEPVRAGTAVGPVAGIADQDAGGYYLLLTAAPELIDTNPRPEAVNRPAGRVTLAALDLAAEALQALPAARQGKLVAQMAALKVDVLALSGLPAGPSSPADLAEALNLATGSTYAYLDTPPSAPTILYRAGIVTPAGALARHEPAGTSPPSWVAQTFREVATGEEVTLIVVAFPRRDACPGDGSADDDQGDGQGCSSASRHRLAGELADWLAARPAHAADGDLIILGSLNALRAEPPWQRLAAEGFSDGFALRAPGAATDRIAASPGGPAVFRAVAHPVLATASALSQITAITTWPANADEPSATAATPGPYRATPSDPVLLALSLGQPAPAFAVEEPALVGRPVAFSNLTTWPAPLAFTWDFGDGTPPLPATGRSQVHRYTKTGVYLVTLVGSDGTGAWATSRPIAVYGRAAFLPVAPR